MCIDIDDLRQEAIKWIKELEKIPELLEFDEEYPIQLTWVMQESEVIIEWIKHFFNISNKQIADE